MNLKVGEKITIVDYGATILTEVVDVQKSSATVAYRSSHGLKNNDEGVYWLRGHHLPDSPEVRGAVTAKALSRARREVCRRTVTAHWRVSSYRSCLRIFVCTTRRSHRSIGGSRSRAGKKESEFKMSMVVKKIKDTDLWQEADVTFDDVNIEEAKKAFAFINKLRNAAIDKLGTDEENGDALQIDYRIEDNNVIVHVKQVNVE